MELNGWSSMYLLKISILFKIYGKTANRGRIIYIGMISSGKLVFELTGAYICCHFLWFNILAYKRAREFFIIDFRYSMNCSKHYYFLNSLIVFQLLNFFSFWNCASKRAKGLSAIFLLHKFRTSQILSNSIQNWINHVPVLLVVK